MEHNTDDLSPLLYKNREWAAQMTAEDPDFFQRLIKQQSPAYLWIGCSDSRVPSTQLVGLQPGDMFVHRNIANVVVHSDLNCLSVLHYGVTVLKVRHIIVCGHYSCGGVQAALADSRVGMVDNWLRHVQDVRNKHAAIINACPNTTLQVHRLCELNVVEQVVNVCQTTVVQHAWERGQRVTVHGLIYDIADGLLQDLSLQVSAPQDLNDQYERAIAQIAASTR
ncbi:Carbonate dehydratase [Oscillochloris trichoides DG-6]|uniref:Carbonic anhydrase 2 n=1 Tax=Oscillochloris trichoides DG-6 TaxID=765420 RepID=E1IC48_9CHLR|nr:carbonate dehydratase [Oscillochloris trichoides]EFO81238.1 Carbonate dehydratase [Oscillochloris trichoides DG-6]